jgi:hypothetical protein
MPENERIAGACGVCGLGLGLGVPGEARFCRQCRCLVRVRAKEGDFGGVIVGLLALGAGLAIGAAIAKAASDWIDRNG